MSRSAWTGVAATLCACGAAEPLVEGPPDPAWTEASCARRSGGFSIEWIPHPDEQAMQPSPSHWRSTKICISVDEDGRRLLLRHRRVADEALGCPTRGLLAGLCSRGPDRNRHRGRYAGADEPDTLAEGSYQDASDGPGTACSCGRMARGLGAGGLSRRTRPPDGGSVPGCGSSRSPARATAGAGVWHPFRNQPGGLLLGTWVNCAEVDDGSEAGASAAALTAFVAAASSSAPPPPPPVEPPSRRGTACGAAGALSISTSPLALRCQPPKKPCPWWSRTRSCRHRRCCPRPHRPGPIRRCRRCRRLRLHSPCLPRHPREQPRSRAAVPVLQHTQG